MKKRNLCILIIVLLLLISIASGTLYVINLKNTPEEETKIEEPEIKEVKEEPKDYLYRIKYEFSDDYYIKVKENNEIEVYHKSEIYEPCPETNCMESTGKYKEETRTINYQESTKQKILEVLNSIHSKAKKDDIDADSLPLTSKEMRYLLALVIDDEDMITIDEDVVYTKESKNTKTKSSTIIHHETTNLSTNNNEILKKIALDLNAKTKKVFEEEIAVYEEDIDEYAKSGLNQVNGIIKSLNVVYYGPYGISFIYYNTSLASGYTTPNDSIKAYYYNYAGETKEFPAGLRDKYTEKAYAAFVQSSNYLNYREDIYPEWRDILKENLFKEGNWNIEEGKLIFYIPARIIGIIPLQLPILTLEVELEDNI